MSSAKSSRSFRARNFYSDAHQKVYEAIITLYDRGNPVDLITLAEELRKRGHIEDIGGYGYLGELYEAAPTAANAEYHAPHRFGNGPWSAISSTPAPKFSATPTTRSNLPRRCSPPPSA